MHAKTVDTEAVRRICEQYSGDRRRVLDILRRVQALRGWIPPEAMAEVARSTGTELVEVKSVVSFYAFLSSTPRGGIVIRLCDDVADQLRGVDRVAEAFEQALGVGMGETTPDGRFSLEWTPCIGMCDQAPAALVGDVVLTRLSTDRAREIVEELREHGEPARLVRTVGDGNNAHHLVESMVVGNIRHRGPVIFDPLEPGSALKKALSMHPAEVIRAVKTARLRGRGGAGFPTGIKWEFTRRAGGERRFLVCNADEGEPGTFKDRVILTEQPDLLFEGMAIAGYAIGAEEGIVYLRGEYAYLAPFLEHVLRRRRGTGLLGEGLCGHEEVRFDIRIQLGAGAYVCGEETALLSSLEGRRGDPRNRPPFPAQRGYLDCPTSVNNVETLCCAARILDRGAAWFAQQGNECSAGTKLFSVAGDCHRPGVYELPFGTPLWELLGLAGGEDAIAVQVGGPSGQMVGPDQFDHTLCYDDLSTGGAVMVFGPGRDLLEVAQRYMDFFVEESCGYCTPCRVGTKLLARRLERVRRGLAGPADLDYLAELAETVTTASRCGLGQSAPHPITSTLVHFRPLYEARLRPAPAEEGRLPTFDIHSALEPARRLTGRDSVHFPAAPGADDEGGVRA